MDPKVRRVARLMGVRLWKRDTRKGPHWNGKTVALLRNDQYIGDSNTIHELAHWAVSERRDVENFGLGYSPEDLGDRDTVIISEDNDHEEAVASALGIAMECRLGMDWKDTFREHSWHVPMPGGSDGSRIGMFRFLRKAGYWVRKDGTPCSI